MPAQALPWRRRTLAALGVALYERALEFEFVRLPFAMSALRAPEFLPVPSLGRGPRLVDDRFTRSGPAPSVSGCARPTTTAAYCARDAAPVRPLAERLLPST